MKTLMMNAVALLLVLSSLVVAQPNSTAPARSQSRVLVPAEKTKQPANPKATPKLTVESSADAYKHEKLTLVKTASSTEASDPKLSGYTLTYAQPEEDDKLGFTLTLVIEKFAGNTSQMTRYTFVSSNPPHYFYIYDPVYVVTKGLFVFKYGRADGTTNQYRVMTFKEGDKQAKLILDTDVFKQQGLRNWNLQVAPDGEHIAYIRGGAQDGPELAYFPAPLELWVCDVATGKEHFLARNHSLNKFYRWVDNDHLRYGHWQQNGKIALFSYNVKSGKSEPVLVRINFSRAPAGFDYDLERLMWLNYQAFENKKMSVTVPQKYKDDSLYFDPKEQALYFYQYNTPKAVLDQAAKTDDWLINMGIRVGRFDLAKPGGSSTFGDGVILNYLNEMGFKFLRADGVSALVMVESFRVDASVISVQRPLQQVSFETRVFSILQFGKGKTEASTLWSKKNVMGASITGNEIAEPITVGY